MRQEHNLTKLQNYEGKRYHCTVCLWDWASKPQTSCPGMPRYSWETAPENLKTETQLKKMGLKSNGEPKACVYSGDYSSVYLLYSVDEATPRRKPTARQLEALQKARVKSEEKRRRCDVCGKVQTEEIYPDEESHKRICQNCEWEAIQAEEEEHEAMLAGDRIEAGQWAAKVMTRPGDYSPCLAAGASTDWLPTVANPRR
jgi:hypothetical protein